MFQTINFIIIITFPFIFGGLVSIVTYANSLNKFLSVIPLCLSSAFMVLYIREYSHKNQTRKILIIKDVIVFVLPIPIFLYIISVGSLRVFPGWFVFVNYFVYFIVHSVMFYLFFKKREILYKFGGRYPDV